MTALQSLHLISLFIPKTKIYQTPFCRNTNLHYNFSKYRPNINVISASSTQRCSLSSVAPQEAILFDIDGTLTDSDPIHYDAFREILQEVGFNNGEPITEEFFIKNISGKHNDELCNVLLPDWEIQKAQKFMEDKEALFRRLAADQLKPLAGLPKLCKWIEDRGLKRAAVTNAPRLNVEIMLSQLELNDFFEAVILASECERAKPFPDPYLKGLQALKASPDHTFVFEDSVSGIKAGVAAGMQVVGVASRNPETMLKDAGATFVINQKSVYNQQSSLLKLLIRTMMKLIVNACT